MLWFYYNIAHTSSTLTNILPWPLLAKQRDFWKPKSQIATTWTFYAPIVTPTPIGSLEKKSVVHEHLKCVLYYSIDPLPGIRNGILSYKSTNGISSLQKHLDLNHHKVWIEWGEHEKIALKDQRLAKKRFGPSPSNIVSFFGNVAPYFKDDPHQKQFEKDLLLFIAKELVPLSFVKSPFFRRLILK
jgi:hypothetical protein